MFWWRRNWLYLTVGSSGVVVGGILGRLLPPFVLDDPFWRSFWVSPAVGGMAAVVAAVIAFGAARQSASASSRGARRQEWWYRAEWALNLAATKEDASREMGLRVLEVLLQDATETEAQIIRAVISGYLSALNDADGGLAD